MKFSDIGLEPSLQQAIEKLGYENCTPIQGMTIPVLHEGRDISGLSQTGTGKTAAFLIPMMDRILKSNLPTEGLSEEEKTKLETRRFSDWRAQNFILILVPTRELAEQVFENIQKLSEFSGLRAVSVYGGTSYDKQKEGLKAGVEFVVATPGRLIDLYKENICDLKQVRGLVFDEADRMFDMGFKDDMKFILQRVPKDRQIAVFSATMNFDVLHTLYQFGSDPVEIDVSRDQTKAENVKDEIFHVSQDDKPRYLLSLLKKHNPKQTIIFSNFKTNVEQISQFLTQNGWPAAGISSLLTQAQRNRVLEQFKADNEKNILVATDVAARGLDIKGVDMVVNYELPNDPESYVHRIGRTGRAGAEGQAFSMVSDRDVDSLQRVEDYLKHKLPVGWLEDAEIITEYKAFYSDEGRDRRPRYEGARRDGPERGSRDGRGGGRDRRPPREGGRDRDNRRSGPRGEARGERRPERTASGEGRSEPRVDRGPRHPEARAQGAGRRNDNRPGQRQDGRPPRQGQQARGNGRPPQNRGSQNAGAKRGLPKGAPRVSPGVLTQVKSWIRRLWN